MILLIDDDPHRRADTGRLLSRLGWDWRGTDRARDTAAHAGSEAPGHPAAALVAARDAGDAVSALRIFARDRAQTPVIVATNSRAAMAAARREGAHAVVSSPPLEAELAAALSTLTLTPAQRSGAAPAPRPAPAPAFDGLVAESPAIRALIDPASRAARSGIPVLLEGESGVGKEAFARAIHRGSARGKGPFVAVNCGALPEGLVESILFGHERGAFTGAVTRRIGKFQQADGGTLFLDEVGELPLEAQVALLRVVQEGIVDPVGGAKTVAVDLRIISATNRDLAEEVAAGRFREDLYYRLAVFPLTLPPLRRRREDIAPLARRFLAAHAEAEARRIDGIADDALALLCGAHWPGNIRQLDNALHRAVVLADGPELTVEDFAGLTYATARDTPPASAFFDDDGHIRPLAEIEQMAVEAALDRYGGAMAEAARRLGIGRSTLYRKTKEDEDAA